VTESGCGPFVVFEGLDGCGKSTQVALLGTRLRAAGYSVHETQEPSNGPVGALIRQVMSHRIAASEETIAALFFADRLDHVLNDIDGMLKLRDSGVLVIADRYYWSSYAYHSLHVSMDWVIAGNSIAARLMRPDLTVFVDVPPDECAARLARRNNSRQRYERVELLTKVREQYMEAFARFPEEPVAIVDGTGGQDSTAVAVWSEVGRALGLS
jgi:dTMP kinase